ncbi:MAG TPA: lysine transporter [Erwiniaceae bacterium]|nr:lysine transporter [Erwiniaceae bacterium]
MQSEQPQGGQFKRSMKARHLVMLSLGGVIGTGLFFNTGYIISTTGAAGTLLAYLIGALVVWLVMQSLGELSVAMPETGAFHVYAARYLSPATGYTVAWLYWLTWTVALGSSLTAAGFCMQYWFPQTSVWLWCLIFCIAIFLLNVVSTRFFAEGEFWFSLIKVSTVIIFIALGVLMIVGILRGGESAGWQNWQIGDAPFAGGFSAMIGVAMIVGFSFQGTELIGIAAGESEDPAKNIPRAVRQVFWRILLFYIFAILIISLIIPYTDPSLLRNDVKDISVSPFTLVFQHAGLLSAAAVMNAVILTAVLSAGNSGMYASTRMLFTLASEGKAPRIFAKLSKNGVPRNALYATTVVAALCFLTSKFGNQQVYLWLLNTSGMTGFIAWLGIAISHYRFRRGYVMQGHDLADLPYRSGFFPLGPIFAFVLCLIITLGQNYQAFLADTIDWYGVAATYIGIPLFLLIWFGYKLARRTRFVRYKDMEFPRFGE